jgi:hypothetical protein
LDANGGGTRGGAPCEDSTKDGNVQTVEHYFSKKKKRKGGKFGY